MKKFFIYFLGKLKLLSEINLARNLIISFICILLFSLLIYMLVIYPLNGDKASSLASMFGFAATLFTPIAAFILINNWKEQVKHEKALECLSNAFNEISQFHYTLYYLKQSNKPDEIKKNFLVMDLEDFTDYTSEVIKEFEKTNQDISKIYNSLSTFIFQFKLIFEKEDDRFEYILDSYFKIHWVFLKIINEYLSFLITAKKINNSLETLEDNELFQVREMQLKYNSDPNSQKNSDGNYIFMSSLYLAEVKKNSLEILKNIRKDL
ncbi:hypothetical protein A1E39_RS09515 [Acinetobacter baumannii]|nr:hypothetical protein [Acinetobacter baumannii]